MYKIVVDTSIQGGFLGLAETDSKIPGWIKSIKESRSSSMQLASMLKSGMDYYSCSIEDISNILVSTGPGSFTGIKIGLAFCYGLVRACPGISLIGVSSFGLLYQKLCSIYEDVLLVVGSTKTQGFINIDGNISNFNLTKKEDIARVEDKLLSSTTTISIGTWKEFESRFEKVHMLKLDTTALHHMIFEAFCKYPLPQLDSSAKLSGSLPTPTYCREPSIFGN